MERERVRLQQKVNTLSELPEAAAAVLETQHEYHRREQRQFSVSRKSHAPPPLPPKHQGSEDSIDTNGSGESGSSFSSAGVDHSGKNNEAVPVADPDIPQSEIELHRRIRRLLEEKDSVEKKLYDLESEVEAWRRIAEVERAQEIEELRLECKQLKESMRAMDDLHDQVHSHKQTWDSPSRNSPELSRRDADEFDRSAKRGERSKGSVSVLESRIRDLLARVQALETEKMKVEGDLLEMRFEREKAVSAAERLARRASELDEVCLYF
jgi:DNA repair exonuclease SbcCD ATPase subunit